MSISDFLPATPNRFASSVGSTFMAAVWGGAYGLLARAIHSDAKISSLHYAAWFSLAFQLKECICLIEGRFDSFLRVKAYLNCLENLKEDKLNLRDLVCYHFWKVIQLKNSILQRMDQICIALLNIRPFEEVDTSNIEEASFFEMCRYRIWPVFKTTVLETVSFALAHSLLKKMGFILTDRTAVPYLLVIRSIVKDIIFVPALYIYLKLCNRMADRLDEEDEHASSYRVKWMRFYLPDLGS